MTISLVVPVFNEESTVELFYQAVRSHAALGAFQIDILFINDGSTDGTAKIIEALISRDPQVGLVNFSRNFGKEPALFAGLQFSTGDAVVPMDVDLQDPIDVLPLLIKKWREGADVVLAKRVDRSSDNFLKRKTAAFFYRVHNTISEPKIEENVGDFRLMSRRVVDAILQMPERKLFMKGILSWVGFPTEIVEYSRAPRVAGSSKFNSWKLWNLALDGITSFSSVPLRIWTYLGFMVAAFSLTYAIWMVVDKLIWGNSVPGYPSLMAAILFLGGVQLMGIGVLGEYIGRIYTESKNRPRYIVANTYGNVRVSDSQRSSSVAAQA